MSLNNALNMFLQGQIEDGKTIIGILYLARNRDLIQ